jgi:superfamily I DNA/RNA helicase
LLICFGPVASAVMNGRLIVVVSDEDNSIFAFSAASFSLCRAIGSDFKSIPFSFLNSDAK